MDRIKDTEIVRIIGQIGEHYQNNISNRFIRPVLLQLQIDKNTWDLIEILTEKMELFRYQGFHLDDLYRQIAACARFIEVARNGNIKNRLSAFPSGPEKILREMAANNFSSNLKVFSDLLNELYQTLVQIDKNNSGRNPPVYTQVSELFSVDRILAG